MLTTKIKLEDVQAIFGANKRTYDLFCAIMQNDVDEVLDSLYDDITIHKYVMFLPVPKQLRKVTTLDVILFSRAVINDVASAAFYELQVLMYHEGFMFGSLHDYLNTTGLSADNLRLMPYHDFEDMFLEDAANDNDNPH